MSTCGDCRFWKAINTEWGLCRAHPPTVILLRDTSQDAYADTQGAFPDTKVDDWCGEWSPKPFNPDEPFTVKLKP
jgi:hypothetical protein